MSVHWRIRRSSFSRRRDDRLRFRLKVSAEKQKQREKGRSDSSTYLHAFTDGRCSARRSGFAGTPCSLPSLSR